jgi:hypothetical protein
MKQLTIFCLLFLSSCAVREMNRSKEKCIVKDVEIVERYGGLLPDKNYLIKTDCGYTIASNRLCHVGDTISVDVYTYAKN